MKRLIRASKTIDLEAQDVKPGDQLILDNPSDVEEVIESFTKNSNKGLETTIITSGNIYHTYDCNTYVSVIRT